MALNIVVFTSRGLGCSLPLLRFVLSLYLFIFVYCSITIIAVFCYYVVNKGFNSMMNDHTSAIRYVIVYRYRIMLLKCPTYKSDVLSLQYIIDTCSRQIFNVKSKEVVHECETEFGVFPVSDVIDIRKINFS